MSRSFKLLPTTVHENFGEETVILNLGTGSYYSTEAAGGVIWSLALEGASEVGISARIKRVFSGDGDEISREVTRFLDRLLEEQLIGEKPAAKVETDIFSEDAMPDKVFSIPPLQKFTDMEEMLLLDPIHEVDEHGWPSTRKLPG
jgi:hypothetical protein